MKKVFSIYKKEMKELFRDKKTLFMSIVFPIILYPVLIGFSSILAIKGNERIEESISIVAFEQGISMEVVEDITRDESFVIKEVSDYEMDINNGDIDIYVGVEVEGLREVYSIYYNSTKENSKQAYRRFDNYLDDYKERVQNRFLEEKGIEVDLLNIVESNGESIAKDGEVGRSIVAMAVPMLLLFPILMAVLYSALDLTSGEKERRTLETLFTLPVKKEEVLLAKLFATVSMGLFSAVINSIALGGSAYAIAMMVEDFREYIVGSMNLSFILTLFITLLPLVFFISGLCLMIGIMSKDFKEAQNYATPVTLLVVLPIYFVISPGWSLEGSLIFVPVLNVFLLFKDLASSTVPASTIGFVVTVNIVFAIISMLTFAKLFQSERILFSEEKGFNFSLKRLKDTERDSLEISEVILFYLLLMILLVIIGGIIQLKYGIFGAFLTQVLLILLPTIALIYTLNINKEVLSLKKVEGKEFIGSIGFWAITLVSVGLYTALQNLVFPQALDTLEVLEEFLSNTNAFEKLIFVSLAPAICEEVMFRGLIYKSLEKKINAKWAIIISGLLFGAFHLYPAKMMPTAILGMGFAYTVYATGSIYPAMVMHFINNAFSLFIGPLFENEELAATYSIYLVVGFILLMVIGTSWVRGKQKLKKLT